MSYKFNENLFERDIEPVFSTGFNDIDELLKLTTKGSIITIGARPSMGKTSFAISILNHLLEQKKKVFYFSLQYSKTIFERRLIANKAQADYIKLSRFQKYLKPAMEFYEDKELTVDYTANITVEEIEKKVKENVPDIVFIDYIQLVKMPKAPNFSDSINLAVQEIKRIADETGCIFVILTQLSRALECRCDKRPMLSDIRNCGLLEEISNVIMMIYRDEYYNKENTENRGKAEISIIRNDFGHSSTIILLFQPNICCFKNPLKVVSF